MRFRNDPEWDEPHKLIMGSLYELNDWEVITQRQLARLHPTLGPHKQFEQAYMGYLAETEKWFETTTRNIRRYIRELRNEFRVCVPIISDQGEDGGYRLPMDMRDCVNWWTKGDHGLGWWEAQVTGYVTTIKRMNRIVTLYKKRLDDEDDGDNPELPLD